MWRKGPTEPCFDRKGNLIEDSEGKSCTSKRPQCEISCKFCTMHCRCRQKKSKHLLKSPPPKREAYYSALEKIERAMLLTPDAVREEGAGKSTRTLEELMAISPPKKERIESKMPSEAVRY
jgi:hypothetical protein